MQNKKNDRNPSLPRNILLHLLFNKKKPFNKDQKDVWHFLHGVYGAGKQVITSKDINLADNLAVACTAQNLLYVTLSLSLPVQFHD